MSYTTDKRALSQMTDKYDSGADTLAHKDKVMRLLKWVAFELINRAPTHDDSKLSLEEKSVFDIVTPRLKNLTYGSEEYKQSLADMGVALEHHYRNNRHHPEHFENGIRGMTIVDIVEMFCDWSAATYRHDDGDIHRSIENNKSRFGCGDVLTEIFHNTATEYGIGKKSKEIKA